MDRLAENLAGNDDGGIGTENDDPAGAECHAPRARPLSSESPFPCVRSLFRESPFQRVESLFSESGWFLVDRSFEQLKGARRLLRGEAADVVRGRLTGPRALVEIDRQYFEREAGRSEQLRAPRRRRREHQSHGGMNVTGT